MVGDHHPPTNRFPSSYHSQTPTLTSSQRGNGISNRAARTQRKHRSMYKYAKRCSSQALRPQNKTRQPSENRECASCGWLWSQLSGLGSGSASVVLSPHTQCLPSHTFWETDQRMVLCAQLDCSRKHSLWVNVTREGRSWEWPSQELIGVFV